MILGLLAMVAANLAAVMGSLSIVRRISSGRVSIDVALLLLCRIVIVSTAVLACGLVRVLQPAVLGGIGLAGIAAWFAAGEQRRLPPGFRDLRLAGLIAGAAILLIGVRLILQSAFFVPYSVDPLSYHLPKIAQWVQQGALLPYPGADIRETFPAGFELVETWWVVFLHHDAVIEFAGMEFLALGAAAAAALARYAGLGHRAAAFASVFYALIPGVALQATACMNDGAVAGLQLVTLALVAFRVHPLLILASIAVGLGIKPTFAAVLPGAALLFWLERKAPALPLDRKPWAVALAAAALAIGGFWYALNTVQHGNPLYPVGSLQTVGRGTPTGAGSGMILGRLNDLAGTAVYDEADHYTVQFIVVAGWGLLAFACGGVGLIAMARRNAPLRRLAAAIGIATLAALWIAPPGSFYLRFILVAPALGAIAAAALGESLPKLWPILALAAAGSFVSSIRPADRMPEPRFESVPIDATVACLRGTHDDSNGESYLAYGPAFTRNVVYLEHAGDVPDLLAQLRTHHVTWVFAQARSGDGSLQQRIRDAAAQGFLRKEPSGLYRVVSP